MHALLVAAAFTISVPSTSTYTSTSQAAADLDKRIQTGALLISRGDCIAVRLFTCSRYTHVATVVKENGRTYVYESANGHGVRRQTLQAYLYGESPNTIYVLNPRRRFSPRRAKLFEQHLKSEIGRSYAIKHFVTGKRANGLHCSEYVMDALMAGRLLHANRPSRVTPASLAKGALQSKVYEAECSIELKDEVEQPIARNRCEQYWIDTKICTREFCIRVRRFFTCR